MHALIPSKYAVPCQFAKLPLVLHKFIPNLTIIHHSYHFCKKLLQQLLTYDLATWSHDLMRSGLGNSCALT